MSWTPISNTAPQYEENGIAASNYYIKFYESGTTTPTAMATDSTGTTTLDKCQLDTEGYPINGSGAAFIPHIDVKYKIVLFRNAADANSNNLANAAWDIDSLSPVITTKEVQFSFASLTEAVADASFSVSGLVYTASYRSQAECTTLGISYPDGGGANYVIVAGGTGTADGGSFIDAGTKQLQLIVSGSVNVAVFGVVKSSIIDSSDATRAAVLLGGHLIIDGPCLLNSGEFAVDLSPHNPNATAFVDISVEGTHLEIRGEVTYRNDNGASNSPSCFYVSADNVKVEGGSFTTDTFPTDRYIHSGNAVAPYKVSNFLLKDSVFNHCRQGCILYNTENSKIEGCFHQSSLLSAGSSAAFKIRGGSGNTIDSCTSYYGLADGNMGIFGTGVGNRIVNCKIYNRDIDGNPGVNTRQGISIDSDQQFVSVIGNYVDDFFFCIDVKTNISGCQVIGNTVKSKKVGIAVRYGEGTQNVIGTTIQGNSVVMAEGITDPTPLIMFTPSNPLDDSGGYTTAGIYIDHMEGAVSVVGNTFSPDTEASDTSMRAVGVVIRGNANTGTQATDRGGVTVTGNNFNFLRQAGAFVNRILGPAIGIEGDLAGNELPNAVVSSNTYLFPVSIDSTHFSAIDAGEGQSMSVIGNVLQNTFNHGPFIYTKDFSDTVINGNTFGSSLGTVLNASDCANITYSNNISGLASNNATSIAITNIDVGIITGNTFKRGTSIGNAISNITASNNLIVVGNYADGAINALNPNATTTSIANNITNT